ncbi:MAG: hypothetical protein Q9227_008197 [Pyrenula ochraceoflavens]
METTEMNEEWPFTLEVLVQPPSTVRPLQSFASPVVVALKAQERKDAHTTNGASWNTAGIIANVNLVRADNPSFILDPLYRQLSGHTAGGILSPRTRPNMADPTIGYAVFRSLRISEPGEYLLRIVIIDLDSRGSEYGPPLGAGRLGPTIFSHVVRVDPTAISFGPDSTQIRMLKHLESEGVWY